MHRFTEDYSEIVGSISIKKKRYENESIFFGH
jgi:hypothetical protein